MHSDPSNASDESGDICAADYVKCMAGDKRPGETFIDRHNRCNSCNPPPPPPPPPPVPPCEEDCGESPHNIEACKDSCAQTFPILYMEPCLRNFLGNNYQFDTPAYMEGYRVCDQRIQDQNNNYFQCVNSCNDQAA